jgi:poly(hydroxyalkanoate) depolymerase family esterase
MRNAGLVAAVLGALACAQEDPAAQLGRAQARLTSISSFGSNPGGLDMFLYAPAAPRTKAAVVVAMHGCTQTADDYVNVGWNALADQYGFYVVYPQDSSDLDQCLDWFTASDASRDQGEALSIKQMVDYVKAHYDVDPQKVFATGLSSGGAMTAVMLAAYPDVFAAGAAMSGIPFGCATNGGLAGETCMLPPGVTKTAKAWGDLARGADPSWTGARPRMSVWQGTSDNVVTFTNFAEMVKQWTDVQGLDSVVGVTETVGSAEHVSYNDGSGRTMVESWAISSMLHGQAIDPANGCGTAGLYIIDEHLCSALYAAKFFGLTDEPADAGAPAGLDAATPAVPPDAQVVAPDAGAPASHPDAGTGADASAPRADGGGRVPDAPNCGCTSGPSGAAALWLSLSLGALALRRRR